MRFEVLGPLRVLADGQEVPITAGRDRLCLAMLLLRPDRTVATTALIDTVWPDHQPKRARSQIHGCISRLRSQLAEACSDSPGPLITTDPEGYRLRTAGCSIDLLDFRDLVAQARAAANVHKPDARDHYRAALQLRRGHTLAGIDRDPIRQTANAIDEEVTRAIEERIDLELELGAAGELISELTDLVHQHPYRERLHAALILALHRADRQADALATYQQLRRTLIDDLGQEPSTALRQLHQQVLNDDPDLRIQELIQVSAPDRRGLPSPGFPSTLADFTGHADELTRLLDAVDQADPYAPLVLTIDGMAGVGKTSLAVRAAHLLASRYPGGQLFIDLQGHSEVRPLEPLAALDTLLRQFGIPVSQIPPDREGRALRWRAALAAGPVLVVFDNAATSRQVRPLLPTSGGCLVIITSRRRLVDLEVARPRSLDTLSPSDAITLLERIAGQRISEEPAAAARVAHQCGHLPLALRLAGARLAHRPGWRVSDLADRLGESQGRLSELAIGERTVASAFALSYDQLTAPSQRLFRRLGRLPGDHFDRYAAAALAEQTTAAAQESLDELVDNHLVQEPRPGHYRLHDLLQVYATELSDTADSRVERDRATAHLLDHYLQATIIATGPLETFTTKQSVRRTEPLRPDLIADPDKWDGDWLHRNRPGLVTAVQHAAERGFYDSAWKLARAMWHFLHLHGHTDDIIDTHLCGLAAAEQLDNPEAVAITCNYLASAYFRVGQYDPAAEYMRRTLRYRQQTGDLARESAARQNLAAVYAVAGQHRRALAECEQALTIASSSGDPHMLASCLVAVGYTYLLVGCWQAAIHSNRLALAVARFYREPGLTAMATGNLGAARARLGQTRHAWYLLNAAIRAMRQLRIRYGEAEALSELGAVHRSLGELSLAIDKHQQALAIMEEAGWRPGECAVLTELGRTWLAAGDPAAALTAHQRALDAAVKIRHRYGEARALDGIAACLRETDPGAARRHWLRALELYRELEAPEREETERQLATLDPPPQPATPRRLPAPPPAIPTQRPELSPERDSLIREAR